MTSREAHEAFAIAFLVNYPISNRLSSKSPAVLTKTAYCFQQRRLDSNAPSRGTRDTHSRKLSVGEPSSAIASGQSHSLRRNTEKRVSHTVFPRILWHFFGHDLPKRSFSAKYSK